MTSGGAAVVVIEQPAESLAALDIAFGDANLVSRIDDLVFQSLMISFFVIMK